MLTFRASMSLWYSSSQWRVSLAKILWSVTSDPYWQKNYSNNRLCTCTWNRIIRHMYLRIQPISERVFSNIQEGGGVKWTLTFSEGSLAATLNQWQYNGQLLASAHVYMQRAIPYQCVLEHGLLVWIMFRGSLLTKWLNGKINIMTINIQYC